MADDVNVVFNVTERGFDQVAKNVEALRRDLEALGIDMGVVQSRLDGIERAATKGGRAVRDAAKANKEMASSAKDAATATGNQTKTLNEGAKSARKLREEQNQLIATRYALYDVANAYGTLGAALSGAGIYAAVVGAQFESAFTNVERTLATGTLPTEIQAIRSSLVQLSGQIPLTFQGLSGIATIGNQMGIAAEDVVDFTGTIARFSSVAGTSVEETTKAFGGFLAQTGLAPKYLENLGASIAKVGIDSNATEAQILSLMREITAGAVSAGFAADQIVGLSGTLASLQIAPERARGALTTYFETLNKAVANGGKRLEAFATITGTTADELQRMVASGEGAEVFRRFLQGLNDTGNTVAVTNALGELGLQQLRVSDTFRRLSGSLNLYDRDQQNANSAFIEGAELTRQYAMTVDDLASQWTIFINGINGLVDAISGGAVPTLAMLFANINNIIFALTDWLGNNRFAAGLIAFGVAATTVIGVMFLFRGLLLAGTAATYAMRTAIAQMGAQALASAGTVRGLAGAIATVNGASRGAAGGVNVLKIAIRGLLATTGIGVLVALLGMGAEAMLGSGSAAEDAALSLDEYNQAMSGLGGASEDAAGATDGLGDSLGGAGNQAAEAAQKVRTLVDYVNDLTGVFRRSSDIRFGSAAAMDEITLKWLNLNEEIQKYQAQVRSLTADRKLREYWLGIAEMYDDQIRASQLREEIAKIDDDLAEANAGASTELEGNSKAAIENRKTMRDLLGSYEDYVAALSAAGASQEQIQAVISQLNGDFNAQAQSLGFSGAELVTYSNRFRDLATIVAQMPRDITVGFNGDPALQAMAEFFARAEEQARAAGGAMGDAFGGGFGGGGGGGDWLIKTMRPGAERGFDWWAGFWGGDPRVHKPIEDFFLGIGAEVNKFFGETLPSSVDVIIQTGQKQAQALWEGFVGWLDDVFPGLGAMLLDWVIPAETQAQLSGGGIGRALGSGVSQGASTTLNSNDPIAGWLGGQGNTAYNSGRSVGGTIAGGLLDGLTQGLSRSQGVTFKKGYATGGYVSNGFAGGGYTGSGHWLEPAGVVHRGEYVIPKRYVDQRTGLPDMGYVANLQRSRPQSKAGYAGGGMVGGGFTGPVELGPASIGALINGLSVRLNVGRERLASSVSSGNKSLAWTGSN